MNRQRPIITRAEIKSEGISKSRKPSKESRIPELLYYGEHICQKVVERRRDDIIRVYCVEEMLGRFKSVLQWCAQQRKAYHVVNAKELEKITGSVHHEGVAILARQPQHLPFEELTRRLALAPDTPLLYLDGVQNPHNIGTIMRVMASFGWPYVVGPNAMAPLSAAGARMSEGGAEFVEVFKVDSPQEFFSWAKSAGYSVYGTSSHEARSLYAEPLAKRSILILGHEVHGMSKDVERLLDKRLAIPASGQVESLNVAVATGILLAEFTRQHGLYSLKS